MDDKPTAISAEGAASKRESWGEAGTGGDTELSVGIAEMGLHGLRGEEQRLRDLPVGHPAGGHLGDAALARGRGTADKFTP
jgi:hypothetical protein